MDEFMPKPFRLQVPAERPRAPSSAPSSTPPHLPPLSAPSSAPLSASAPSSAPTPQVLVDLVAAERRLEKGWPTAIASDSASVAGRSAARAGGGVSPSVQARPKGEQPI